MAIHVIADVRHGRQAVVRALRSLRSGTPEIDVAVRAPHTIATAVPHLLYDVRVADIAAGKLLDAARPVALRYLVERDETAIAIAETTLPNALDRVVVMGFESARAASALCKAIETVEHDDKIAADALEFRVLRIQPLYLSFVWLHGQRRDWLVPFGMCPAPIKTGQLYTPAKLTSLCVPLAKQRIARERKRQKGLK